MVNSELLFIILVPWTCFNLAYSVWLYLAYRKLASDQLTFNLWRRLVTPSVYERK